MSEIETGDAVPVLVASPPAEINKMVEELLDTTGVTRNRDLLRETVLATLGFATANAMRSGALNAAVFGRTSATTKISTVITSVA